MAAVSLILALLIFSFNTRPNTNLAEKLKSSHLKAVPKKYYAYFFIGLFLTMILFSYLIHSFLVTNTLVLLFGLFFVL